MELSKDRKSDLYSQEWYESVYVDFGKKYLHSRPLAMCLKLLRTESALDIGSAGGYLVKCLSDEGISAHGVDVSRELIDGSPVSERLHWIDIDNETLPFRSSQFSVVMAFDVMEHCFRIQHVLEEINRVVSPSGLFLVTVPEPSLDHSPTHEITIGKSDWIRLIESHSFARLGFAGRVYFDAMWSISFAIEVARRVTERRRGRELISAAFVPFGLGVRRESHFLVFKKSTTR